MQKLPMEESVMELQIVLLDCSMKEKDPTKVAALQDSKMIHTGLTGLTHKETRARKFIVLQGTEECYLVIGPQFDSRNQDDPAFYTHSTLRQVALFVLDRKGDKRYQIKGGGQISLEWDNHDSTWVAGFGGNSYDYGTYDPSILSHAEAITDWLGFKTRFNWNERRQPSKKP